MIKPLGISGAWLVTPRLHADDRGSFFEFFRGGEIAAEIGYQPPVAQGNCSISRKGVIRGIHFADVPPGQSKFVTCVSGAILDVVVDLRAGSPGFGQWEAIPLDPGEHQAVYLSEGLGHAFVALTDEATVMYLCSTGYNPGGEHGVHPLDPGIGISWPPGLDVILSEKDAAAPSLDQALAQGLLPDYAACQAYLRGLAAP